MPIASERASASPRVDDLMLALQSGDHTVFELIYDAVAPRVYGLCLRLVRDPELASEVTQEVLLTIWVQRDRFDPALGNSMSWILTIAHRRAVDSIRSHESTRNRDDRYHRRASAAAEVDSTVDMALISVESDKVRRALASMKDTQRQALTLAYFDGMTHTEIAKHLSIPLGTAKTRTRDALIALRAKLQVARRVDGSGAALT